MSRRRLETIAQHVGLTIAEPARELGVLDRCDVLVVGSGPAGLSAALGAARAGADVILLERYGCFGGVITTVGMETLGWYRYEGTTDAEGIGRELERAAARMGGTTKFPYNDSECLDADKFKLIADRLVAEAGVRPLLHCLCVDTLVVDGRAVGVVTESKSGRLAVLAKRTVDCTGDADVAFRAGCPCTVVPVETRMGCTTVFGAAGVDATKFKGHVGAHPKTYSDWAEHDDDPHSEWHQPVGDAEAALFSPFIGLKTKAGDRVVGSWSTITEAGEATNLNLAHLRGYDCLDVKDLTAAEMAGRRKAAEALETLREQVPGFEGSKLRTFSTTIGVRDTRKIVGRHNLCEADVRSEGRFDDAVGVFPEFLDGYNILVLPTSGRYFQVPYGCLVPVGVDNLLVAGRCVAGDKVSHAAMRNMMACTVSGQAAGVAAAVSLAAGQTTAELEPAVLQRALVAQGVRIR